MVLNLESTSQSPIIKIKQKKLPWMKPKVSMNLLSVTLIIVFAASIETQVELFMTYLLPQSVSDIPKL